MGEVLYVDITKVDFFPKSSVIMVLCQENTPFTCLFLFHFVEITALFCYVSVIERRSKAEYFR